ncbi:wax ester/triacylglycerol synthase family O-acyltransferase [Embleya scabrispora]|uniref:wax ester/triacylglycerol synthase family O-acyltransferase n=1 Tax=Embleya scabrispora TaxID=159449 RepID=UPI000369B627|nr:wax ester/triacylglycerol synthase family O-acyltransferase [Embleya scabrispora]MYS83848.1 wax ester/triacylglycerol synthase family O-acyltransferase [Streptomyces sp. SID5474]
MKLSGLDSAFLALESREWPAHVVCLTIVDASDTGGRVDRAAFERTLAARLPLLPLLRRKLVQGPWGLARPHWVEDPDFELANHLHRATVEAPGGRRELAAMAEEIYRHRLPRNRPLWDWWIVEGLEHGRVAHLWKVHHACIDGRSGAAMQEIFFDADPGASVVTETAPVRAPVEALEPPQGWQAVREGALSLAGTPVRVGRQLGRLGQGVVQAAMTGRLGQALPLNVPRTRYNEPIGKRRSYGFCTVSLSDVKQVKNAFGVKVNDVVLAIVSGALREQLDDLGELPERQLIATVPVDATRGGERAGGNMITGMLVGLATDVAEPAERLLCIHENSNAAKAVQSAMGGELLTGLAEAPPPALLGLLGGLYRDAQLASVLPALCNATVSNVPGPRTPLYAHGQKVEAFHSMGIIADGFGLFIGGMSYHDQIDIGVLADKQALPDPFALADSIVEQLNLLLKAADEIAPPQSVRDLPADPQPVGAPGAAAAPAPAIKVPAPRRGQRAGKSGAGTAKRAGKGAAMSTAAKPTGTAAARRGQPKSRAAGVEAGRA